jgi:hypothetical protein
MHRTSQRIGCRGQIPLATSADSRAIVAQGGTIPAAHQRNRHERAGRCGEMCKNTAAAATELGLIATLRP